MAKGASDLRMAALTFVFALSGCSATFEAPPRPQIIEAPAPADDQPRALCLVRARLFKGLVAVRCSDLAQEFRP